MLLTYPFKWDLSTLYQPYNFLELLDSRFYLITNEIFRINNFDLTSIKQLDNIEFEYYINKMTEIQTKEENKTVTDSIETGGII